MSAPPVISTVLLSWNRKELLRRTVESYLARTTIPHELFIVDNASTDGCREYIRDVCAGRDGAHAILLDSNRGGEAINLGLARCRGRTLHVSENDLEYLDGWDRALLAKFDAFPELGQLSLFSPFYQIGRGEIWRDKAGIRETRAGQTIYRALANVGTSSVIRREVWERGVRWHAHGTKEFWSPDDGRFSADVKAAGFGVAWNDEYVVVNWGHNIAEFERRLDYYIDNARGKEVLGLEALKQRMADHGWALECADDGHWTLDQRVPPSQSRAASRSVLWREWMEWLRVASDELAAVVPEGATLVLVDGDLFGRELVPGRCLRPFLERDGAFWGAPDDDAMALRELARERERGASFIAFTWNCFWWIDYYAKFGDHLRRSFPCVLENDRLVVFDLRT